MTTVVEQINSWIVSGQFPSAQTMVALGGSAVVLYVASVRALRYRNLNYIRRKYPDPDVCMTDKDAAEEVYNIMFRREFPYLARQGTELALFKTFSVPTISKLLVATGEFGKDVSKRAEDTELILGEMLDVYARCANETQTRGCPLSAGDVQQQKQRAELSLTRLNELHGKYNILNSDFVYTLSLFVIEPMRWIEQYEWRALDEREYKAAWRVWYDIGQGMHLKDIPESYEAMLAFKRKYEEECVKYSPTNWKCAEPTVMHILQRAPKFIRPILIKYFLPCVLEPHDCIAFDLPQAPPRLVSLMETFLGLRRFYLRYLSLPRNRFVCRTPFATNDKGRYVPRFNLYKPIYPDGYAIEELGPLKYMPTKCPVPH
ncbi:hypothetical protein BCR43DRAFT_484320 [Syncephalastrum racemosum]|uniref:ER-bound oxygenase mpaB/mpaB'/Rubber oxygenase catalytic domain-containing protein n=1 Tax=Syncephalastrum racemosum TaxID=13706 RepID=A0A1X2HWK8_SYNRA|nr:hypothetical protein BCR43DRAFT_484320 [Syncephalastrum racemosum]